MSLVLATAPNQQASVYYIVAVLSLLYMYTTAVVHFYCVYMYTLYKNLHTLYAMLNFGKVYIQI